MFYFRNILFSYHSGVGVHRSRDERTTSHTDGEIEPDRLDGYLGNVLGSYLAFHGKPSRIGVERTARLCLGRSGRGSDAPHRRLEVAQ